MEAARQATGEEPIFQILPYRYKTAGVVTTGSEVLKNRISDTFTPVIEEKLAEYQVQMTEHVLSGDDHVVITKAIEEMIEKGVEMVICTGGMSVDPDDRTPLAIKNTGARIVTYGAPMLPGAMFLLAYYEHGDRKIPVLGLPGCVMYAKRTIFDLVLPRLLAGEMLTEEDFIRAGEGGLCLSCPQCTYPNCGFGKGV